MDKIKKALSRLGPKEKQKLKGILLQLDAGDFKSLDLKKLRGRDDIFRVRKSNMRIIFRKKDNSIKILTIERRSNKTYNK